MIDWLAVDTIAGPVLGVIAGAALTSFFEKRPNLISYYGHVAEFLVSGDTVAMDVYTHSVIVRNNGKKTAFNVRLGHNFLPDFKIYPKVGYTVFEVPNGGKEIVFPTLVANEQVTVSYIYYPPLTASQINAYTKSDEGAARIITMLPQPQSPAWLVRTILAFTAVGGMATLYILDKLIAPLFSAAK